MSRRRTTPTSPRPLPTPPTDRALSARYAERLAASALSPAEATGLGLRLVTVAAALRWPDPAVRTAMAGRAGLLLPYHDAAGTPTGYVRYRWLDATASAPGAARYTQPVASGVAAYLPRVRGVDWQTLLASPTAPLLITEGELKAASATVHGWPCVGLGGVWSWRSAAAGVALLPELESAAWRERPVYLVFDSDIAYKPAVRAALLALAEALTARGARVLEVVLDASAAAAAADGTPRTKLGLDDLIASPGGTEALGAALAAARPLGASLALWRLSDEVLYVRDPGLIVELATGQRMSARAFVDHAYANRVYVETTVDAAGRPRLRERPLARTWLAWPHRGETARLVYRPGAPRLIVSDKASDACYNLWSGWGVAPAEGDVGPWHALVDHLFDGDAERIDWFTRWAAYPVQHPGAKLLTATLLWGIAQGTGKSLVGYALGRVYGRANFAELQPADLHDDWNDWQAMKQFIMGDELSGGDRRADGSRIKRLVTAQTIRVQQKYVPSYTLDDCANYYFTSNHPDPFHLELGDRRFFVHEVTREPREPAFYATVDRWLHSAEGPAALHHYLRYAVALDQFNPNGAAPWNEAKADMVEASASDLENWMLRLVREPLETLRAAGVPAGGVESAELMTAEQLRALYDPAGLRRVTATRIGIAARRCGLPLVSVWGSTRIELPEGKRRLYAIHNRDQWIRPGLDIETVRAALARVAHEPGAPLDRPLRAVRS